VTHKGTSLLCIGQTGVAVGMELDNKMPLSDYYEYFGPDHTLHITPSNMENQNTKAYIEGIRNRLLENLARLQHSPSVAMHARPRTPRSRKRCAPVPATA